MRKVTESKSLGTSLHVCVYLQQDFESLPGHIQKCKSLSGEQCTKNTELITY